MEDIFLHQPEEYQFHVKQEPIEIKQEPEDPVEASEPDAISVLPPPYLPYCCFCKTGFLDYKIFQEHLIEIHNFSRVYRCSKCPFNSTCHEDYVEHTVSEHEPKLRYVCVYCPYASKVYENYTHHVEEHHEGFIDYKCCYCDKMVSQLRLISKHKCKLDRFREYYWKHRGKDNKWVFCCKFCGGFLHKRTGIMQHILELHKNEYETSQLLRSQILVKKDKPPQDKHNFTKQKYFFCLFCRFRSKDSNAYIEHTLQHQSTMQGPRCTKCNKTFASEIALFNHNKVVHLVLPSI